MAMADKEKTYKINVETDQATKDILEIKNALASTEKELSDLQSTAKKSESSISSVSKGFKGLGTALKGLGIISIVVTAFTLLKDMFMKNEKVAKAVEVAMNFIQIVMNKIVDTVVLVVEKIKDMSGNFDATKAVISGLIKIGFTPLKLAFNAIILGVKELMLGWTKLFDKKNTEKINSLTEDINGLKKEIKETAVEAVDAGKNVISNVGKAVTEVANGVKEISKIVVDQVKSFDAKTELANAKRAANAKRDFGLIALAAEQEKAALEAIGEQYRQTRDDAKLSYEERLAASEKLKQANIDQLAAAKKLAQAHIDEAAAAYQLNKNTDTLLALKTAQNELIQAQADYEGKVSEQKAAQNGLIAEQQASIIALTDAEFARQTQEKQAAADREKDFTKHQQMLKQLADETLARNLKVYEDQSKNLQLTQAEREMALQNMKQAQTDYNIKIQELDNQTLEHTKSIEAEKIKLELDKSQIILNNEESTYEAKKEAIEKIALLEEEAAAGNAEKILEIERKKIDDLQKLEDEKNDKLKQKALDSIDYIKNLDEQATQFRTNLLANQLKNGKINQEQYDKKIAEIEQKAAKRKKAYAIAETIINTASAIVKMLSSPGGIPLSVAAGIIGAAQIATIASTPIDGGGGSASAPSSSISAGSAGSESSSPSTSFSFDEPQKTQPAQPVIKTYVVSKDISNQQQLDRQIVSNGTIN